MPVKSRAVWIVLSLVAMWATGETLASVRRYEPLGYADAAGTFEEVRYEDVTGAVSATRDRAGQWLSYAYDAGGRVTRIHSGESADSALLLMRYEYDAAGRLSVVRNKDAAIAYDDYDRLGRPGITRTTRYRNASGLEPAPQILDVHERMRRRGRWLSYAYDAGDREMGTGLRSLLVSIGCGFSSRVRRG